MEVGSEPYSGMRATGGSPLPQPSPSVTSSSAFAKRDCFKMDNDNVLLKIHREREDDDLVSSQYFSRLSIKRKSIKSRTLPEPSFLKDGITDYVGSCNGLLHFDNDDGDGVIWNPTTNELNILPMPDSSVLRSPKVGYTYTLCSGFGFDSASNDYKVIRFVNHVYESRLDDPDDEEGIREVVYMKTQVILYSLKSNSWKDLPFPGSSYLKHHCVYLDGSFYWLQLLYEAPYPHCAIHAFDLAAESFSYVPCPQISPGLSLYNFQLVDFHGSLGVVLLFKHSYFELWAQTDGYSWVKKVEFCIDVDVGDSKRVLMLGYFCGFLFLVGASGQVLVYDCAAKKVKKLDMYIPYHRNIIQLIPYVATKVSPFPSHV